MKKTLPLLLGTFLFVFSLSAHAGPLKSLSINTHKGQLLLGGKPLADLQLATIKGMLGKPSRVKTSAEKVRYEKRTITGKGDDTVTTEVKNYYYLYDRYGLVFYTTNTRPTDKGEDPVALVVVLSKKVEIKHSGLPPQMPKRPFSGKMTINGKELKRGAPVITDAVTPRSDRVQLFNALFAPAAAGQGVESVYSITQKPGVQIFLDSVKGKRAAYIEIKLGR